MRANPRNYGRKPRGGKDPAAVALGRKGGKVGGRARARTLSGAKREQIARHAAKRRWGGKTNYTLPAHYLRTPKHH